MSTPTLREAAQQALEALETVLADAYHRRFLECCGRHGSECCGNPNEAWTPEDNKIMDALSPAQRQLSDALRATLAEPQEPVKFLANGTRFKMSFFQNEDGEGNTEPGTHVTCFEAFEEELDGRWVALVPAEDDCHLKYTAPQPKAEQPAGQEPVAHIKGDPLRLEWVAEPVLGPLYAAPQPRKRLTREDIQDAVCDVDLDWHQGWTLDEDAPNRYETLCRAIEAAVWGDGK